jgi:hypothetical protein
MGENSIYSFSKTTNFSELLVILQYFSNNSIDSLTRVPKPFKSVSEKLGKILNLEVLGHFMVDKIGHFILEVTRERVEQILGGLTLITKPL